MQGPRASCCPAGPRCPLFSRGHGPDHHGLMEVRYIDDSGIRLEQATAGLQASPGGFYWVDIAEWSTEAEEFLRGLGCHEMELELCRSRNHVPTVHAYTDHVFITTQSPLLGHAGHVHLLELDQIIGLNYLVTVHGPLNPVVDPAEAMAETEAVLRRIKSGRFRPTHSARALLRRHLGGGSPSARPDHPGGREAPGPGAARHGVPAHQPRGAAGADVPDPARADHGTDDGGPVLRRVGPDRRPVQSPRRLGAGTCATSRTSSSGCVRSPTGSPTSCSG